MHVPYVLTNLEKNKSLTIYTVAYIRPLNIIVTTRATRFIVSVPAEDSFQPIPQLNVQECNLGSRLNIEEQ